MNNKIIIGIIIVVLLFGGFFVMRMNGSKSETIEEITPSPSIALPTISNDISVELTPTSNNQSVVLEIKGLTPEIETIEYELTYNTGAGLPRGVLGKITLKGEKEIKRDDIVLGTCSSGKCVYDTGVTAVDLSLKFNTPDGPRVFRKTYPF